MYYRVNIPRNYNFARQCTITNEHEISKYKKVQTLKKKKKIGQKIEYPQIMTNIFWKITIRLMWNNVMQFLREKKKEKEICFRNLGIIERKKYALKNETQNVIRSWFKAQSPLLRAVVIYMLLQKWVAFISLHFYTRNIYSLIKPNVKNASLYNFHPTRPWHTYK